MGRKLFFLSVFLWAAVNCQGSSPFKSHGLKLSNHSLEGDILIVEGTSQRNRVTGQSSGLLAYNSRPWPSGIVPVVFEPGISQERQNLFFGACHDWGYAANIVCVPRTLESEYLRVTTNRDWGCSSTVGFQGGTNSAVNFGHDNCWQYGTVLHEIGHTLGLMHEHQRPDRDQYVRVDMTLVGPGSEHNYEILPDGDTTTPYDFYSIMHYQGGLGIVTALPPYAHFNDFIGRSNALSEIDRLDLGRIYGAKPRRDTIISIDVAQRMVQRLYNSLLFRQADYPAAMGYVRDIMRRGVEGLVATGRDIALSEEYRVNVLEEIQISPRTQAYNLYFGLISRDIDYDYVNQEIIPLIEQGRLADAVELILRSDRFWSSEGLF
ncbi:MAG: hypothetical protein IT289_05470 [Oligoflexia bacterium]|nr:hypothetical protein [Oligoflexia bacterium]